MRRTLLALVALSLAAISAAAFPDGPQPPFEPEGAPEELIARHAAELGISEATIAQIRSLAEQHRAEREVIVAELHKQKLALREKLHAAQPNEAEVIALARTIGTLETDLSVARLTSLMRLHALLTPAQNEALHEKMRGRFHQRRALLDRTLAACEAEIAEHCDEAGGPPGHGLMCLVHKRATEQLALSAQCEEALRELPPRHMLRHRMPPPGVPGGEKLDIPVPAPDAAQEEEDAE